MPPGLASLIKDSPTDAEAKWVAPHAPALFAHVEAANAVGQLKVKPS